MSNSGISPSLRNSRKLVAILAVAAVLVAIGGISQNDGFKFLQGQMSGVKSDETIMSSQISPQKTISTLTPVITKVNSVKTDVSSTYSSVNPKVENIAQSKSRDAYGITSTQNTLTQKTWNIVEYRSYVFDSSWNLYVGTRNQITYYNFEDNTKKTWTLPNEHSIDGSDSTENPIVMALDSKGNLFYPDYDPIKGISNITKLDTTSNIFRIYSAQAFSNYFAVDSSDNIIAQNYKLNLNDNTYSHWFANCGYAYLSPSDIEICSGGSDVRKFDYETGSLTTWTLPEG